MPGSSKRPTARRGSSSAPDPFNIHAELNLDPNRSCTNTLTIVKVPDEPSSPVLTHRKSLQRKFSPSSSSHGPDSPNRLSFAFSSFSSGRPSSPTLPGSPSPSSSPRLRPSSPHLSAHFPTGKPRLTPDQIVDLARQAANPTSTSTSHVFTPLPDDVYLPFLDRPAEVAALISYPPDVKLFALLAQTFPIRDRQAHPPLSDHLPRDPTTWTYHHLIHHLTKVDRDVAPDFLWSIAVRKCILSHSELIWERVKGGLGIPPELDVDYQFLEDDQASPEGSEDGDGQGERNLNWEEPGLDSPLTMKAPTGLPFLPTASPDDHDHHSERKAPIARDFAYSESAPSSLDEIHISIEPLVANPNPPLSLPAGSLGEGLGLGDIAEGAEEEEEAQNEADEEKAPDSSFNSILPSQIQGLRISTSPLSSAPATPPRIASSAALPSLIHISSTSSPPTAHSRTSSVSSLVGPFNRSESTGALSSLWHASAQAGVFFSGSEAGDSYDGKEGDQDKIQGMGPMFPGNFARLGRRLGGTSSSSSGRKLPHTRYITSGGLGTATAVEGATPSSPIEKFRTFSHAGGQRPFIQPSLRRRSWGAGTGPGMSLLSGA